MIAAGTGSSNAANKIQELQHPKAFKALKQKAPVLPQPLHPVCDGRVEAELARRADGQKAEDNRLHTVCCRLLQWPVAVMLQTAVQI